MAKLQVGKNDLATTNPNLAKEWHPTKNGELKPSEITSGSSRKVWWKCPVCGGEWQKDVYKRINGWGCPYCAGKKVLSGFNDLATLNPRLAKEWHPTKNGSLMPTKVRPGSHEIVWWRCPVCGGEWQASVHNRSHGRSGGDGCPYCAGKKVLSGYNDLATLEPELAAEWHPTKNGDLTPKNVTIGTNKKVWWKCQKCGHEWERAIATRVGRRSCPNCANRGTSFPEQAIFYYVRKVYVDAVNRDISNGFELDIYIPSLRCAVEYDGIYYHGKKREERDQRKDNDCRSKGIKLIRIREFGLNKTDGAINIIRKGNNNRDLDNAITELLSVIDKQIPLDVNVERDSGEIRKQYYELLQDESVERLYPELRKEWDYEKNGLLTPDRVSVGSQKKVWWKCSKGHEWQASIKSRTDGRGCPYCARKKILKGYNDLATVNPGLAKEWHPTKNGSLTPSDVMPSINRKVWWQCSKGHEWQETPNGRTSGKGCPYCSGHRIMKGFNDLETVNPELAKEWHPTKNGSLTPSDVTKSSGKRVWWKCQKCGHEWESVVANRSYGRGCPICANEKRGRKAKDKKKPRSVQVGVSDLLSKAPELAKEWHPTKNGEDTPQTIYYRTNKRVWWKCQECGYEWEAAVFQRVDGHCACPKCIAEKRKAKRKTSTVDPDKSIAKTNPELVKEWHPTKNGKLTPSDVTKGSSQKVWWQCSKGHEWQATLYPRTKGVGCPYCAGKKAISGVNDLGTKYPNLAKEWHPTKNGDITPQSMLPGSGKKVWWKCAKGHEWQAIIKNRRNGDSCPYCSGHKVLKGYNDLETLSPELAKEWHPTKNRTITPSDVTKGSGKKVWWKCPVCGHEWQAAIYSRVSGNNCPKCHGKDGR